MIKVLFFCPVRNWRIPTIPDAGSRRLKMLLHAVAHLAGAKRPLGAALDEGKLLAAVNQTLVGYPSAGGR